ncbi:MAG: glucokinase, partial [Candidatus Acidiferrum sp.]
QILRNSLMILAGDVGGTKTVCALYDESGGELRLVREATVPSQAHKSLEEILSQFLHDHASGKLLAGCFGVAGAVIDGKCHTTNLPWQLDEVELARAIGAPRAKLLNDLEAAAYGMLHLRDDELVPLNPHSSHRRKGNVAVIAAGTGLGEAMLYWDGEKHHPLASEGGHVDFAPQTDEEIALYRWLRGKYGHVSYERILSGPGFYNVFSFLRETGKYAESRTFRDHIAAGGDPNIVITQLGIDGDDPLCSAAVDLFCSIYGSEAGNLALKCVAVGGVFVGGGIAPNLGAAVLIRGRFLNRFIEKGRFDSLMKSIEVNVALNPRAPLLCAVNL